jgi:hypothetical protein
VRLHLRAQRKAATAATQAARDSAHRQQAADELDAILGLRRLV